MRLAVLLAVVCGLSVAAGSPETVMITYQAKPGAEAALAHAIERHWATAREQKLVLESPHVTLRGVEDDGRVYFVDVFAWRDAATPDAAPKSIQAIWAEMNGATETRGGKPGILIQRVSVVSR